MNAGSFVPDAVLSRLPSLSRADVDGLDFGAVKLDDDGTILLYNRYESELAGISPLDAEGRSFFTEVAPCTNNRLFAGKFRAGVEADALREQFGYTFTYRMRPTMVRIEMHRDANSGDNWLFVKKA